MQAASSILDITIYIIVVERARIPCSAQLTSSDSIAVD